MVTVSGIPGNIWPPRTISVGALVGGAGGKGHDQDGGPKQFRSGLVFPLLRLLKFDSVFPIFQLLSMPLYLLFCKV